MPPTVLIVDDQPTIRKGLRHLLERKGYHALEADSGAAAVQAAQAEEPEVILLDLKLPDGDGLEVLERLQGVCPEAAVILLTGHGSVETAVTAIKKGAEDFLEKDPSSLEVTEVRVEKALEMLKLRRENRYYRHQVHGRAPGQIPGASPVMRELHAMVDLLAKAPQTTVLVQGESGSGKELVARAIHYRSARADKPFLEINCAGLSEHLLESELFGHERGAFTDAKALKRGLLEIADGGTLFLDEIGDMPLPIQPKFLRVLENRTFRRVGGTRDISVDVRVITASNKDLVKLVEKQIFREDLYYRLKVMPVTVPPLRERGNDILVLADLFVQELNATLKKRLRGFSPEAQQVLLTYAWPGNVRELRNVTERGMILCQGETIPVACLPAELQQLAGALPSSPAPLADKAPARAPDAGWSLGALGTLEEMEQRYIREVLASVSGNRSQAARLLGISRSTLQDKIRRYGLS
ncbi:MAG: sigma-54-dependent Fis family transcriptional regulator [candidate division NC10 bacterium]|nr:sigma-54-dependent Fis family transcriptional regulator [candidate division NC10 bacterium]